MGVGSPSNSVDSSSCYSLSFEDIESVANEELNSRKTRLKTLKEDTLQGSDANVFTEGKGSIQGKVNLEGPASTVKAILDADIQRHDALLLSLCKCFLLCKSGKCYPSHDAISQKGRNGTTSNPSICDGILCDDTSTATHQNWPKLKSITNHNNICSEVLQRRRKASQRRRNTEKMKIFHENERLELRLRQIASQVRGKYSKMNSFPRRLECNSTFTPRASLSTRCGSSESRIEETENEISRLKHEWRSIQTRNENLCEMVTETERNQILALESLFTEMDPSDGVPLESGWNRKYPDSIDFTTLSAERSNLQKSLVNMTEQRDLLQTAMEQAEQQLLTRQLGRMNIPTSQDNMIDCVHENAYPMNIIPIQVREEERYDQQIRQVDEDITKAYQQIQEIQEQIHSLRKEAYDVIMDTSTLKKP